MTNFSERNNGKQVSGDTARHGAGIITVKEFSMKRYLESVKFLQRSQCHSSTLDRPS